MSVSRRKFSPAQIRAAELLARRAGITRSLQAVGSDRADFIELHVDQLVELLTQDLTATADEIVGCLKDYGMEDVRPVACDLVFVVDRDLDSWAGQAARVCRRAILSQFGDSGAAWQVRSVLPLQADEEMAALLRRGVAPNDRRILVCWRKEGAA